MLARSVLHRLPVRARAANLSNYVVLGDEQKLKEILAAEGSKMLYFTATWCPPCRKIAPMFEKMSKEFADTVFVKIDIDDHGDVATAHKITSVPTFKAISGHTVVAEFSGADEAGLRRSLELLQK
ncbi:thioredoxin-like protein [Ochromonadaceae sp. CCMP2298]|nr:thioredoxin-like protein [Ochromonadaceae sp. CCMP2298]